MNNDEFNDFFLGFNFQNFKKQQEEKKKKELIKNICFVGFIYAVFLGNLLGWAFALITGNHNLSINTSLNVVSVIGGIVILAFASIGYWAAIVFILLASIGLFYLIEYLFGFAICTCTDDTSHITQVWEMAGVTGVGIGVLTLIVLIIILKRNITLELLMQEHVAWLLSLPNKLVIFHRRSVDTFIQSQVKSREWDKNLIVSFCQELAEVFPEEWDEWQHWISDMMDSRTRMQSKGMNHRLISLITFYRLTRFVWHIGIDKVFILATRRATR